MTISVERIGIASRNKTGMKLISGVSKSSVPEVTVQSFAQNQLRDKNYGILAVKGVSFKGALIEEPLISKKLNAAFTKMLPDEITMFTKDLKEAVKGIRDKDLSPLKGVMKRMYVIEDKSIDGHM